MFPQCFQADSHRHYFEPEGSLQRKLAVGKKNKIKNLAIMAILSFMFLQKVSFRGSRGGARCGKMNLFEEFVYI